MPDTDDEKNPAEARAEEQEAFTEYIEAHEKAAKEDRDK